MENILGKTESISYLKGSGYYIPDEPSSTYIAQIMRREKTLMKLAWLKPLPENLLDSSFING